MIFSNREAYSRFEGNQKRFISKNEDEENSQYLVRTFQNLGERAKNGMENTEMYHFFFSKRNIFVRFGENGTSSETQGIPKALKQFNFV